MEKSYFKKVITVLVIDDCYGKINSHWAYSTEELVILDRVFYDESNFEKKACNYIQKLRPQVLGFSGKGAAEAAKKLDKYVQGHKEKELATNYKRIVKVLKVHNTNLLEQMKKKNPTQEDLLEFENVWVRVALDYPFDMLMIQTFGDTEIINKAANINTAYWIPYSINEKLFYPRNTEKDLDIGMFFKLERHPERVYFVDFVKRMAERRGWRCCFSDTFWGEEYAKNICRSKILLHYTYFGDIPWRLYEAGASKLCLLTDPLSYGVENLFVPNKHYCTYNRDLSDLEQKIDYLLSHPEEQKKIAENAYQQVIENFTWGKIVKNKLSNILHILIQSKRD